jgi:hypothetical protein
LIAGEEVGEEGEGSPGTPSGSRPSTSQKADEQAAEDVLAMTEEKKKKQRAPVEPDPLKDVLPPMRRTRSSIGEHTLFCELDLHLALHYFNLK